MANQGKEITIEVTKEMQPLLERAKMNLFHDCNQSDSDMIYQLVMAGLKVMEEQTANEGKSEQSA